jgi:SAM-dependent methyltransferase
LLPDRERHPAPPSRLPRCERAANGETFGTEWHIWSEHDDFFASPELFHSFLPALARESVAGHIALDAGCGAGRWTQHLVRLGADKVIALDYSSAVEVCARKTASNPEVAVVQGSILAPPLRRGVIDVAVSIGVIHHLSDPLAGLRGLHDALAPSGVLACWLYGREGNELYLALAERMRKVTQHMSSRSLLALSTVLAVLLRGYIRTVNRWVPLHRDGSPRLPMQTYLQLLDRLSLRDLTSVVYDQLAPALARYYRREEVETLIGAAGFELEDLTHRAHSSWAVLARPRKSLAADRDRSAAGGVRDDRQPAPAA